MTNYYQVLDHGFVALTDSMGSDEAIERAARVSYASDPTRKRSDTRQLLRSLYRRGHSSPFEMVEFVFHCKIPIFVARQWIRHRTASVNEQSGRYTELQCEYYTPPADQFCRQSTSSKQGRGKRLGDHAYDIACKLWRRLRGEATTTYQELLKLDVARELSRIDLPLSTYTQWYWKIDLKNLLHFLKLRLAPDAQWEIQQYTRIMAGLVRQVVPLAWEAFEEYDLYARTFSRTECQILRTISDGDPDGAMPQLLGLTSSELREFELKLKAPDELDLTLPEPIRALP